MPYSVKNISRAPVSILLNSRSSLHLPPGHQVEELADSEVQGNAKVDKLIDQRLISISKARGGAASGAAPAKRKRSSKAGK